MAMQRTLSIIKPDAVARGLVGPIYQQLEAAGLRVIGARMLQLSTREAGLFYAVHRERPFYPALVEFMASGPVMVQVLEGEDAVTRYRALMGATDPARAEPGTLRAQFASSVQANAVHGSDSPENAAAEIAFFFDALSLFPG